MSALALLFACAVPGPPHVTVGLCDAWNTPRLEPALLADADAAVAEVAALGVAIARPHRPFGHVFSMNLLWPAQGEPRWDLADGVVRSAGAVGVSLLATIYPEADPGPHTGGTIHVALPADPVAYAAFVAAMVERYDGDGQADLPDLTSPVRAWEIANEADCAPDDTRCQQDFAALVRMTVDAIRGADPDAFVLAGAAPPLVLDDGSHNDDAEALYRHLDQDGALDLTDALNVHLVTGRTDVGVGDVLDRWAAIVGDRPMWITELATRSVDDVAIVADDEADEAAWLIDAFDQAAARDVDHVFWCTTGGEIGRYPAVTEAIRAYIGP